MRVKTTAVTVELSFEKDFLTFLEQTNALERFCTRFCADRKPEHLASLISDTLPQNWILSAFGWDDVSFWRKLSDKWAKTIYQPDVHVTFEVLDKDKSQEIWDKLIVYSGSQSLQGKYYRVRDNSWNRPSNQVTDSDKVWDWDSHDWKDLVGKTYLILSEKPVVKKIESWCGIAEQISRSFIKIWVPKQECVQWVLYRGCSYVKTEKN